MASQPTPPKKIRPDLALLNHWLPLRPYEKTIVSDGQIRGEKGRVFPSHSGDLSLSQLFSHLYDIENPQQGDLMDLAFVLNHFGPKLVGLGEKLPSYGFKMHRIQ